MLSAGTDNILSRLSSDRALPDEAMEHCVHSDPAFPTADDCGIFAAPRIPSGWGKAT